MPTEEERLRVLEESHDSEQAAHLGVDKTHKRVLNNYFWPGLFLDVVNYVRNCVICQRVKIEQRKPMGLLGQRIVEKPWDVVAIDIVGPLPRSKSGFVHLLVMQDLFTKWIELEPLRAANGPKIALSLENCLITRWGCPRVIVSDNGTEFVNREISHFCSQYKIRQSTIPPYDAQANPVERVNRVLKTMIVAYLKQVHREWDLHLSVCF